MRNIAFIPLVLFLVVGCNSVEYPSVRESKAFIRSITPHIEKTDEVIELMAKPPAIQKDVEVRINSNVINAVMGAISGNRSDDVKLNFPPTRHLFEERKYALGFPYTNYIDIESGKLNVNLSEFRIIEADQNTIATVLSFSGEGNINISGKYLAVKSSASPSIRVAMRDTVMFALQKNKWNALVLTPLEKMIALRVTIGIELLGWEIPYTHTEWLNVQTFLQPIPLPVETTAIVQMPAPNDMPDEKLRYIPAHVRVMDIDSKIRNEWLHSAMNVRIDTIPR